MPVEVHVVTPEREVWSGEVSELIARGVDGEVGILGGHAPLLIQLAIGPLRLLTEGGPEIRAVVDGGFLHVASEGGVTRADVLATDAVMAEDIDVGSARRRLEEWEGKAAEHDDAVAQAEVSKAAVRVALGQD